MTVYNTTGLGFLPQDVTVSNDGGLAVVRTARRTTGASPTPNGFVYVWDLSTDPPLFALAEPHPSNTEGGDVALALDDLVLTLSANSNDGGAVAEDLRIWSVAGGSGSLLASQSWLWDCWDSRVGYAGVGSGSIGAVRHRFNGITLWDLVAGTPLGAQSIYTIPVFTDATNNVFGCTASSLWAGDAFGLADSIEITPTRVVTIANIHQPGAPSPNVHNYWGGIGIAEFDSQPGWPKTFLTQPPVTNCPTPSDPAARPYLWVHDLAISPDGSKATVSGTDYIGIFNINRGTQIGVRTGTAYPTPSFYNVKGIATLDSVEMTDTRAVVIGNAYRWNTPFNQYLLPIYNPGPPNDNESFEICVLSIRSDAILEDRVWTAGNLLPGLPTPLRARACDLAITPNQSKAIVSTRRATIVFDLKDQPSTMVPQVLLTTTDPMDFVPGDAELSDVVACTDARAVVIGRRPKAGAPAGTMEGVIEVLNLMPPQLVPPAPPVLASILSTVVIGDVYIPTDVVITPDGSRAIVRSNRPDFGNNDIRTTRITVVELLGGTTEFQTDDSHGALGVSRGKDHLECTNEWVVSAGETSTTQCSVQFIKLP